MLKISVSGVRGIVYKTLTPQIALEFGLAFGTFINPVRNRRFSNGVKGSKIVVGRDTRITGRLIRNAVTYGLQACGCEVIDLGICPTPTVLLIARRLKCNGVVITASHNPAKWNGLKFANKDGTFLNKEEMESLFNIYRSKKFNIAAGCKENNGIRKFNSAKEIHIKTVIKHINRNVIKRKAFRIACDFCNGTGSVITKMFLEKLGCKVYTINDKPDGRFAHNPEPSKENLKALSRLVKRKRADLGLAQDPDADRLALCDERGWPIGEENTLCLAIRAVLKKKKGKVVVNLSTSKMIDDITDEFGVELFRTPVGEINVVEKMKKVSALIGGEGNGGVVYPKINFCRDSLVGIGIILEYLAKSKKTLREAVSNIAQYKMVKGKLSYPAGGAKRTIKRLKNNHKGKKLNLADGIKIAWPTGWVHVRPSNTEPIIRVVAEARTAAEAKRLYNIVKNDIIKER